jgi:lipopolysaccharide heptosyltransferase II
VLQISNARERALVGAADALLRAARMMRRARQRPTRASLRRILVLRLERIGDLMMSLPALHALRTLAPQATIDLVTGSWNAPLARLITDVDRVETLDARWLSRGAGGLGLGQLVRHARSWRPRRYDLAINLESDIRSNLMLASAGAAWTAGFDTAGGGPLLDDAVGFALDEHTATNGVRLALRAYGETLPPLTSACGTARGAAAALPRSPLALPAEAAARAASVLGSAETTIGIQVGAGRLVKQWPADRFAAVARRLAIDRHATIVLTGAAEDRTAADVVRTQLPQGTPVIDLVGAIDLVTLTAVLARLSVFITPDTGPMHMAAVVDTPVVGVFGPSSPERWGPLARRCRIVRVDLACSPCNRIRRPPAHCVGHTPDCLNAVNVESVYEAAVQLLDGASTAGTGRR